MDIGWIQVFVLTLSECVAPAGKTVCQQQEFDLQFLTQADCEYALEELLTLKDASSNVIVNRSKSSCIASARESTVFSSVDDVNKATSGDDGWRAPDTDTDTTAPAASVASHEDRLEALPNCEDFEGAGACKMGGIIVEAGNRGESVEVWRKDP